MLPPLVWIESRGECEKKMAKELIHSNVGFKFALSFLPQTSVGMAGSIKSREDGERCPCHVTFYRSLHRRIGSRWEMRAWQAPFFLIEAESKLTWAERTKTQNMIFDRKTKVRK